MDQEPLGVEPLPGEPEPEEPEPDDEDEPPEEDDEPPVDDEPDEPDPAAAERVVAGRAVVRLAAGLAAEDRDVVARLAAGLAADERDVVARLAAGLAADERAEVDREDVPPVDDEADDEPDDAPVEREAAPVDREDAPVERDEAPVDREAAPVERDEVPVDREDEVPLDRFAAGLAAVEREDVARVPVAREDVERDDVPVLAVPDFRAVDARRAAGLRAAGVAAVVAEDVDESSPTPTRCAICCTCFCTCSSVSARRASRRCWTVWTSSSRSSWARLPAPAAPPAAPWKVRSTAERSESAAPLSAAFFFLSFLSFLAMGRKHTPIHLRPHTAVAERVLAPGDPGRALRLAQLLIDGPKMLNHHRGLWGYSGPAADGEPLTIQSTGMGGPSVALIVDDLVALGAERIVRVGTCIAVNGVLALGDLLLPDVVLSADGTSRALGAAERLVPDPVLHARMREELPAAAGGTLASVDLAGASEHDGAAATDLEAATLIAAAMRHGCRAASALVVVAGPEGRLDDERLHAAEAELGRAALAAFG
jgi:uridine phosphorylase